MQVGLTLKGLTMTNVLNMIPASFRSIANLCRVSPSLLAKLAPFRRFRRLNKKQLTVPREQTKSLWIR